MRASSFIGTRALLFALFAGAASFTSNADAGGLNITPRGVRPLARGGAFVAGADDVGALAYNPAGLFDAGSQFLLDAAWVQFSSEYTREANVTQIDPNTGEPVAQFRQTFATVEGSTPFLPIPTLAVSFQPHRKWVVAVGVWAPYAALTSYPEEVDGNPAPQRYSLITLEGTALAVVGAYAAFAPSKNWRVGAGVEVLAGTFKQRGVFSGCIPDRFLCAPEQPEWDITSEVSAAPIIAPSGRLGAVWIPHPALRVGAAFSLPYFVRAPATVKTRLPSTPQFENASQEGEDADVSFDLPWTLQAGVEGRPLDDLRIEIAFNYEAWHMHDAITVEGDGLALRKVAAFPDPYYVPPITVPRNFQDSVAFRLGGEYGIPVGGRKLDFRAGVSYETSAIPTAYESVLTLDSGKVTTALGAGLHLGRLRLDATFAHVFYAGVDVDPKEARILQITPLQARPPKVPNYVNGGSYSASANVIGLGMAYSFEPAPAELVNGPKAPEPPGLPPAK